MSNEGSLYTDTKSEVSLLNEQAAPSLSRIMSMDRGSFMDKMKGDPFEYEIVGDPCEEPDAVTFKVIAFSQKAMPSYKKRHQGKLGKRVIKKGKFIFPKSAKYRKLGLAGKDSWVILQKKMGGAQAICDLVKKAEEKEKKPDADTGGPTPPAGAVIEPPADQAETETTTTSTAKPGSLKYWVENGTTGLKDRVFDSAAPKKALRDAIAGYVTRMGNPQYYTKYTLGHALGNLRDVPAGSSKYPEPSRALEGALVLMQDDDLESRFFGELSDIFEKLQYRDAVKKKMQKDDLGPLDMLEFAKFGSKDLANYLDMSFFGALDAPKEKAPEPEKAEKTPEKKPAEKTVAKLTVPQGDLMNKEVELGGIKVKITKDKMFVNGKPYVATTKIGFLNPQLRFTKAQGTGDGVILGAGAGPLSDEGPVKAADLVKYAQQIASQGSTTINIKGREVKIARAKGVAEARHITPQQFNQIILRELRSLGLNIPKTSGILTQERDMKIKLHQLRQIISEEIAQTLHEQGSAGENLDNLILRIIDASGSKVSALKDATAAIPGEAESLYFDEENDDILLFATRDDMLRWERAKSEKERAASQPPPPKSQMDMPAEELLASVNAGYPSYRSGGPGRVLHPAEEAESAQEQRDDLVKQWDRYKSIPGATISFYKMPDDYKPRDRWDRARAGKLFADVDYPSLD